MTPFHAAQAADPFDPVPMLILADHLEEHGDQAGADSLRGLVAAGLMSIHSLAIDACSSHGHCSSDETRWAGDDPRSFGCGYGDSLGSREILGSKNGFGDGYLGSEHGFGIAIPENGSFFDGEGTGFGDGIGGRSGYGEGNADEYGIYNGMGY